MLSHKPGRSLASLCCSERILWTVCGLPGLAQQTPTSGSVIERPGRPRKDAQDVLTVHCSLGAVVHAQPPLQCSLVTLGGSGLLMHRVNA